MGAGGCMARKMVVRQTDGTEVILTEVPAEDEAQLQAMLRDHPEVLPLDDFELSGPMLVVGKETQLASGAVDLVGLARGGEPIVVEFKTGPQNSDFRSALAQLMDYGSHLWEMDLERFERSVAVHYFASDHCTDARYKGITSLRAAAKAAWPEMSDAEWDAAAEKLQHRLASGAVDYVLAAQRFTEASQRTIHYLNQVTTGPRFYAVEVVRFRGSDGESAESFECRTLVRPTPKSGPTTTIDRDRLLSAVTDERYRGALGEFLGSAVSLGLVLEWGSVGVSIRARTPWRPEPVTLGWLFPPGRSGWMGLTDLTLGYDPATVATLSGGQDLFERYGELIGKIPGSEPLKTTAVTGRKLPPACVLSENDSLAKLLTTFVEDVREA